MAIICSLIFLHELLCVAGSEIPPEVLLLARMKQNMAKLLARVPDYTCMETVQRFHRTAGSPRFRLLDTIRLEVAYVGGREVYSRPGARQFDDRRVHQIVAQGLTSDGDFAIQARTVFLDNMARITFGARETFGGRETVRYDYKISLFGSGWTVRIGSASGTVAEHGSFWADAGTLDLLRIERYADEIPPDLAVSAIRTQLDYGKARLDGEFVSIPRSSDTVVTDLSGAQDRNSTGFSQCHAARGETAILFDGEPEAAGNDARAIQQIELRANLELSLELEDEIDGATASVGDEVNARVAARQGAVPAGAVARGRIRRIEREGSGWAVSLEFVELEFDNKRAIFRAKLRGKEEALPGVADFSFDRREFRLPRGFRMEWRTTNARQSGK